MATSATSGSKGKVLVIVPSESLLRLANNKEVTTGFFLKELGQPLIRILEAGYSVEFANPSGNAPPMDPLSDNQIWFGLYFREKAKEKQLLEQMKVDSNFANPKKFADLTEEDLNQYVGIFLPGGHAPMINMWNDAELGRILLHFHNKQKPTAMICHAPVALLSTKMVEKDSPWAYQNYHVTCYSDLEEKSNELLFGGKLPFKVETVLRENGAILEEAMPMMPKVTVDRELISGQGPTSADQLGKTFVEKLQIVA
eukprot:jgi/Chlat1/6870/Chrsp51S00511